MPIVLSEQDVTFLLGIVTPLTSPPELETAHGNLVHGFSTYASEELILGTEFEEGKVSTHGQRQGFFQQFANRLLTNLVYAGKDSATVFVGMRQHIYNTFKRLGIPERDRDDLTDGAIFKLWRFQHAEKYNPLRSAWKHHVYNSLWRMSCSYYEKRQRDPLALGYAFQQYDGASTAGGDDLQLEPYEIEQDMTPEQKLIVGEALLDFEVYLAKQPAYRTGVEGKHKEICTLLAPGTKEVPVATFVMAYMVRKSDNNCRIEMEDGDRYLIPSTLITNIRPNNLREVAEGKRIIRTPLALFQLLMTRGAQIHEVSRQLKVGPSTAHNWVRKLEQMFQDWWKTADAIHTTARWMARPVRVCPGCQDAHLTMPEKCTRSGIKDTTQGVTLYRSPTPADKAVPQEIEGSWCDECYGWTLDGVEEQVNLPYPWGHIRGTHDLQERSAKYKPRLMIQKCSL